MKKYGAELIAQLEAEIVRMQESIDNRYDRIERGLTDMDDCFISQKVESEGIATNRQMIDLIKNGGTAWFLDYATLDGQLVDAMWCNTKYGWKLRVKMPDGDVIWTASDTAKGLAKRGLKKVEVLCAAWFKYSSPCGGMAGVYAGSYQLCRSEFNYATGETVTEPLAIRECEN